MKYEIKNRYTGAVQFIADIDCAEDAPDSLKRGLAVQWAIDNSANLSEANLFGANLSGAYLFGANLSGANLSEANLFGAYLSEANLFGANLPGANLSEAYLSEANLFGAYLSEANLSGANLPGANLSEAYLFGANLSGANLSGAYLFGANLSGATYGAGISITKQPIFISGLEWNVLILDTHMKIGCEIHSHKEWAGFSDRRIAEMDGMRAVKFWRDYEKPLLDLCEAHAASLEKSG